jgi:hypothetical protein
MALLAIQKLQVLGITRRRLVSARANISDLITSAPVEAQAQLTTLLAPTDAELVAAIARVDTAITNTEAALVNADKVAYANQSITDAKAP